ncbi:hypothetical protein KDD17_07830 [Sulfitobacter albidus]|uniref:Phosphotransferase n=1 Tax=Sulfitobacter albidus TaxID=2829501 RepID=A0A975JG51_9RHOB|nr:hypothetical protein [Sulfitobacter albidus]QUJ77833.1 hypothetical protein KDD17_07830 [Sulfitobacter albidus]
MKPSPESARAAAALADAGFDDWTLAVMENRADHIRGGRCLIRAAAPDGAQSMVLKVYAEPGQAQLRFDQLTELRRHTERVVAPVFLDTARNLYAMQDAGRTTLADDLGDDDGSDCTLEAMRWLQSFVAQTPTINSRFDPEPTMGHARQLCDSLDPRYAPRARRALRSLTRMMAPYAGHERVHHTVFGDMKPENLCRTAPGAPLIGIDYVAAAKLPLERDVAHWLAWMQQRNWRRALSNRRLPGAGADRANLAAARQVFGPALDPGLLRAFLYAGMIEKWVRVRQFQRSPDLVRTVEVRLGLRPRVELLRPSLRRLMGVFRQP